MRVITAGSSISFKAALAGMFSLLNIQALKPIVRGHRFRMDEYASGQKTGNLLSIWETAPKSDRWHIDVLKFGLVKSAQSRDIATAAWLLNTPIELDNHTDLSRKEAISLLKSRVDPELASSLPGYLGGIQPPQPQSLMKVQRETGAGYMPPQMA